MTTSGIVSFFAGVGLLSMSGALCAQAPTEGSDPAIGLEEIIVTANRRSERSQDVPIAINALTASAIESAGVTGTSSLVAAVPSLKVERRANGAAPFLRGIGSTSGDVNAESSVAIYVDGVYQPVAQGNFFEFNNVERVEVLKGPQGTLFGRNATGGVVQIITKDPTFEPAMSFDIGYANYNAVSAAAYGSAGITDTIAVNLAVMYKNQQDGWGQNLFTGQDIFLGKSYSARGKILIQPDDRTRIIFAGDYYYLRDSALSGQAPFGLSGGPRGVNTPEYPAALATGSGFPGRYNTLSNFIDGTTTRNRGLALNVEHDFGTVQFRSISAYRQFDGIWNLDQDLSPLNIFTVTVDESAKTLSQEVHLYAEPESKMQWLVGAYYFRNNGAFKPVLLNSDFAFPAPFTTILNYGRSIATSTSVFAQATYPLTEQLRLTLGGRYTWDKAEFTGEQLGVLPGVGTVPFVPLNTGKSSYSKPTWRVALDYKIDPDVLAYVSYNRGTKSGNFSVSVPNALNSLYRPEQLDAYEIGLKSEFFDRRLRLNFAGFYYDYQNLQFQKLVSGGSQTVTANSAKLYGAELELSARATEGLTISGNIAYLHSRIGDFPNAPATIRVASGGDIDAVAYNAKGNRTPNSPRFSGNIGFSYVLPTGIGEFNLNANVYYTDKYPSEIDNRLWIQAHPLVNAGLKWTDKSGALSLSVWGKNLSNEYYYAQLNGTGGITDLGSPAAPRTYGITFGYRYK